MRILFLKIPREKIKIRKRIFSAFGMPHFIWLFATWFHYTDKQRRHIEHVYCSGIRLIFALQNWDDETVLILSREKSLLDHIFSYWSKFTRHLENSPDALVLQQTWQTYKCLSSPDKSWYRSLGFNKRSRFLKRLIERMQHLLSEWEAFEDIHREELNYYSRSTLYINLFVYKHFLFPTTNQSTDLSFNS